MHSKAGPRDPNRGPHSVPAPRMVETLEDRLLFSAAAYWEQTSAGMIERPAIRPPPPRIAPLASLQLDSGSLAMLAASNPVSTAGEPGFQIEIDFPDSSLTSTQKAAFTTAAARWERILTADIPDDRTDGGAVDDVRIEATGPAIDGAGGVLGQAGPDDLRPNTFLPKHGTMMFDQADLQQLQSSGQLVNVILHEMGHVLGFGTIWDFKDLLTGEGGANPRFTGARATAEYNAIFGRSETSVPVENTGNPGTRDSHWREADFDREVLTGFLDSGGAAPLSRVTAAQFIDLGYPGVDVNAADQFLPAGGNPAPKIATLTAAPDPVPLNSVITLSANGVTDNSAVSHVRFYRQTNSLAGLQVFSSGGDAFLGEDLDDSDGYTQSFSVAGLGVGTYTFFAQAEDDRGLKGPVVSTQITVVPSSSPTPSAVTLASASDTGRSHSDGLTNLNNGSTAKALQFIVAGTSAGATVTLFVDGAEVGSATGDAGSTTVATNGALALSDGPHTFTARQTVNGLQQSNVSPGLTVTIDTGAPKVTGAAVASSSWTSAFRAALSDYGYEIPTGSAQLAPLPWLNLNQFTFFFSEDVAPTVGALNVNGARTASYPVNGLTYDDTTLTATWTLATGFSASELLTLSLNTVLTDAAGNAIDGEWTDGASVFPSGNGAAGGAFSIRLNILPADVNQSGGAVNASDVVSVRNRIGRSTAAPGSGASAYSPFVDINGDGQINASDLVLTRNRIGTTFPVLSALRFDYLATFGNQLISALNRDRREVL